MPKAFDECAAMKGSKIRTIQHPGGKYQHICIRPKGQEGPRGGRSVGGEVKSKKG